MRFEFATAERVVFGPGVVQEAGPIAARLGSRALIVGGRDPARTAPIEDALHMQGIDTFPFRIVGEPTTDAVFEGTEYGRGAGCDVVVGVGGGSPIDAAKAIAALLTNPGQLLDYLEVIGLGKPLGVRPAPCIAVPTTAGTGAEVTRNAVLLSPEHRVKVSMRHPWMLPDAALVDPLLTHSMPPAVTASTGLDALTQLLEVFVSNQANPLTDGVCREGLHRAARSLAIAYREGDNAAAREDMAIASLFGGLALANAKLGAVHGFAGPLGGMFPAPHGVICARLLPSIMAINLRALRDRRPDSDALPRYDEVARILTGQPDAVAEDGVAWIQALCRELQVQPLSEFGLEVADFPVVVEKVMKASSTKGNPIVLTDAELTEALGQAFAAG